MEETVLQEMAIVVSAYLGILIMFRLAAGSAFAGIASLIAGTVLIGLNVSSQGAIDPNIIVPTIVWLLASVGVFFT